MHHELTGGPACIRYLIKMFIESCTIQTIRNESARVLVIHTGVVLGRIVAIDGTYEVTFVGCKNAEGSSRKFILCVTTTPVARTAQAKIHLFTVYRGLLTLHTE